MFFLEVFDHGKFVRVVGGGSTVLATQELAYRDIKRYGWLGRLDFIGVYGGFLDGPYAYIAWASFSAGMEYRVRPGI